MSEEEDETNLELFASGNPFYFEEAVKSAKSRAAMDSKIKSIEKNDTWVLINLPAGAKKIGVKWIYKTKLNEHGEVDKFKARLVAKGYMANIRGVDGYGQPFDLPTISPLETPLGFEPVTLALIPLVGHQVLPTLLKAIAVRKGTYPSLLVHSPKCLRRIQWELMGTTNPPIYQHSGPFRNNQPCRIANQRA